MNVVKIDQVELELNRQEIEGKVRCIFDKYYYMQSLLLDIANTDGPFKERASKILAGDYSSSRK